MANTHQHVHSQHVTIVVLGASGDLAKKKTYPALFGLFKNSYLPAHFSIVGYARSEIALDDFRNRISQRIKFSGEPEQQLLRSFLAKCYYVSGKYDDDKDFQRLCSVIQDFERHAISPAATATSGGIPNSGDVKLNRIFYMALPPSVFVPASKGLKENVYSHEGWNRLIVEKPFGKDLDSSKSLSSELAKHWTEDEVYRIDHYLGKEMVKNLIILRFANVFMDAVWNRHYIDNVQITFKEPFGTEGRGGYFDEFGIIRDVMQNHLLQILSIVAMEKPVSLSSEDVRDEKVKVLRCIPPLTIKDTLMGQYVGNSETSKPGYLDDDTVPQGSKTPTFAAAVFRINNDRWFGVPFILKCGKAVNEQKTEIRIQFRDIPGNIFKQEIARNELVIRVQPEEAVYMKFMNKVPGLVTEPHISELDLSYSKRYADKRIPEAYEALLLDVFKGDQSNFVRNDELDAAWKIFTPVLHEIDSGNITPEKYVYGSRGPEGLDAWVKKHGYSRSIIRYDWAPTSSSPPSPNKL